MTKQEKMKIYKRRQIALICTIAVIFIVIIIAIVRMLISKGNEEINNSVVSNQLSESISDTKNNELSSNENIPVDGGHENSQKEFYFSEKEITIDVGEEYAPEIVNNTNESENYIWESSNSGVAIVEDGVIIGQSEGSCDITAQIEGTDYTTKIRVYVESNEPKIIVEDGITYVDGILIANKSYSLPADYNPDFLPETQSAFDKMAADAAAEGLNIYIASGFRSYDYQSKLYNNYASKDGYAAADTYSARPGHSEHQTGLAFDLNTIDSSFEFTPEYEWVSVNAHKYGFIIRYPKGKEEITGYIYEPWHLRYLGVETATAVYESGLCLEEYLGIDSVYDD